MTTYQVENELHRLSTFYNWPKESTVSSLLLARCGFSYSGKGDEVQCPACKAQLRGWSLSDNPYERHKSTAPDCPFVKGDVTANVLLKILHPSGNYATHSTTTDIAEPELDVDRVAPALEPLTKLFHSVLNRARKKGLVSSKNDFQMDRSQPDFDKLRHDDERLRTFHDWPASALADPEDLAGAGFFYTGSEDRVQCGFCRGFVRNWLSTDIPVAEHKKHFPECLLVRGMEVGNVPKSVTTSVSSGWRTGNESDTQMPNEMALRLTREVQILPGQPKYPEYGDVCRRIQSFRDGKVSRGQTAEGLADAGWYYIGPGDKVYCFQCGGNLKDWEPEDDPWEEHKKWYSNCAYIKNHPRPKTKNLTSPQMSTENQFDRTAVARVYHPEPREIKARMDTPTVRAILDMGYSRDLVKMAIEYRLSTAGDDFPNAESLLEAVFQLQVAEPQTEAPAFGQISNYAAGTLRTSSAQHSATSVSTARSSQEFIPNHRPDSVSLSPFRPASTGNTALFQANTRSVYFTDAIPSCQSMISSSPELPAESATIALVIGNELAAEAPTESYGDGDIGAAAPGPNLAEIPAPRHKHDAINGALSSFGTSDADWRSCKICLNMPLDTIYVPCGHGSCQGCWAACRQNHRLTVGTIRCPFCRTPVNGVVSPIFTNGAGEIADLNTHSPRISIESEDNQHENDDREWRHCRGCLWRRWGVLLLPCRDLVCRECSSDSEQRCCLCRAHIEEIVPVTPTDFSGNAT